MDICLDYLRHFIKVLIDNFVIFSSKEIIWKVSRENMKLHPRKCFIGVLVGELLGHVVSVKGIQVNLEKLVVFLMLMSPTIIMIVKGFLGYVSYYQRFIYMYAKFALLLI